VTALGRGPDAVVGKPSRGLFDEAVALHGAHRPLAVGDRLDTDIEGAILAGMDSLLVLTGVCQPAELLAAPPKHRPTHLAETLDGLFEVGRPVGPAQVGGWRVTVDPGGRRAGARATADDRGGAGLLLALDGDGAPMDALRALCGRAWDTWPDGPPAAWNLAGAAPPVSPVSPAAKRVLAGLRLA
jgi:hypothetical protein